MTKRVDTVETVVDVFNIAMDIQELYLKSLEILGMGHAAPALAVSNHDLAKIMDTSDEWIFSRTGISSGIALSSKVAPSASSMSVRLYR